MGELTLTLPANSGVSKRAMSTLTGASVIGWSNRQEIRNQGRYCITAFRYCELARGFPVSRPAISQHLRILKDAGLVVEGEGRCRTLPQAQRAAPSLGRPCVLDEFAKFAGPTAAAVPAAGGGCIVTSVF
jgi:DNA-binding transcriptional ArsR family regulator